LAAICGAAICGAAILWPAYYEKATRKLAEAARLYRARAEHGDTNAQYRLGSLYYYGKGVPQDYPEAVRWYRKPADQGIAKAQYAVGYCYFHGRGVPQDSDEAARWYRKAAEQGDAAAQWYLGHAYRLGQGVPRNWVQAARWNSKVVGAAALHCTRRLGWTSFGSVLLALVVLVVPERRWGRAKWLRWTLLSGAGGLSVIHSLSGSCWTGWGRILDIGLFAMLSAMSAIAAVVVAVRERKHGVGPVQPPIPEGTRASPA
jgi:hypothetical protein